MKATAIDYKYLKIVIPAYCANLSISELILISLVKLMIATVK